MAVLYLEPFGGLAGDMLLAALLDLEDERFALGDLRLLGERLVPGELRLEATRVKRGALAATHLAVATPETVHPPHRRLDDLLALVGGADLPARARERTEACLVALAEAEAHVHGIPIERVHFHEVGAVDTLIDVAGAAFALERLGVERVVASPPLVGSGTVRCAHGEMPVPAPGTAALLRGLPATYAGEGERLTPTGAALLRGLPASFDPPGALRPRSIGYGAGTREDWAGPPNVVRVTLADDALAGDALEGAEVVELACNLDDATGEELGHLLASLREAGALDVWSAPAQMKKGRPGVVVHALARPNERGVLERVLFDLSPTLGVRATRHARTECAREECVVEVRGARVRVKRRRRPHAPERLGGYDLSPEYEDLARLAREHGLSLRALEREAIDAARASLEGRAPDTDAPRDDGAHAVERGSRGGAADGGSRGRS